MSSAGVFKTSQGRDGAVPDFAARTFGVGGSIFRIAASSGGTENAARLIGALTGGAQTRRLTESMAQPFHDTVFRPGL